MPPKSDVWRFYSKCSGTTSICELCKKILKSSGNTTNLVGHLKAKHKDIYNKHFESKVNITGPQKRTISPVPGPSSSSPDLESQAIPSPPTLAGSNFQPDTLILKHQPTVHQSWSLTSSFKDGGEKYSKLSEAILFMICKDNQPISMVENEGFRYLMKASSPHYTIPSRKTFDVMLDKKYEVVSSLVKTELSTVSFLCLTSDIWTETFQTKSFLGVTAHYISEHESRLTIESIVIGVKPLMVNHTGENIAEILNKIIVNDWNLKKENISAVVTDGAANMVKGVELAFGKTKHSHCFAHLLNLMAQKSIDSIPELKVILDQVKLIVTWFKHSVVGSDALREKTKHLQKKTLIQSVSTRWNSTYYMVERFLLLREEVNSIITFNTSAPKMISAADIEILKECLVLLRPIEYATKEACGEKFVTSSIVIPMVRLLKKKIMEAKITMEMPKKLKELLLVQWDKRFKDIEHCNLFSMATLIDPRFKNLHFDDKVALANALRKLSTELRKDEESSGSDSGSSPTRNPNVGDDFWDDHHKLVQESGRSRKRIKRMVDLDVMNSLHPELSVYLKEPIARLTDNPLEVWGANHHKNSSLLKLAKKYLTVMATSVASERAFSISGDIVSSQRSCLSGEKVDKLIFLRSVDKKYWGIHE